MLEWFLAAPLPDRLLALVAVAVFGSTAAGWAVDGWTRWQWRRAQARFERELRQ